MVEYIFKNKSALRKWGLQLILTPQSCLKKFASASAWKVSMPFYKLHKCYAICEAICLILPGAGTFKFFQA
jgi:hypothetical protein